MCYRFVHSLLLIQYLLKTCVIHFSLVKLYGQCCSYTLSQIESVLSQVTGQLCDGTAYFQVQVFSSFVCLFII